jgi:ABC-type multidrug transport system ATPase subunit
MAEESSALAMKSTPSQHTRAGWPNFTQQCKALFYKNFLLSRRNLRATVLQLGSSLFFIFLIFCVDLSNKALQRSTTNYKNLFNPTPTMVPAIPACENGFYIKPVCLDFIWIGTQSPRLLQLVNNIRTNNPGREIPEGKVRHFATSQLSDEWLLANPMTTTGALYFEERGTTIAYGIQTNSTATGDHGRFEDPNFTYQIPLQVAAEREIARLVSGDPNLEWKVGFTQFAHPAINAVSVVGRVGPAFLLAATMFGFVIQLSNLVTEKELRLRQMMATMGLIDSAYWITWLLWEVVLVLISSLLLVLFGMMFQFNFFINNNFGILFFLFFLFQLNMIGLAFMVSTFVSKSTSATNVGFFVFIIGFLTQLVTIFGFPYDKKFSTGLRAIWSLFPPNVFAAALDYLGLATSTAQDPGIQWKDRSRCSYRSEDCVLTMNDIYGWLLATFFLWFVLAIYFDNVFPDVNGVRKPCFYFLSPNYWLGKGVKLFEGGRCCSCTGSLPPPPAEEFDDPDVSTESALVKQQKENGFKDPNVAVHVQGLVKTYPGSHKCVGCRMKATKPYHAVKGSWFNIEKDKLFCLLGPNGAGKTTTINCLTGTIPTSAGDAMVYGESIRSTSGVANIRKNMGVCPQFDVLWEALTAREHLYLFGSIKGLPPSEVKEGSSLLLEQVKLTEAANVRAGSYSGGMKRRLSVAIALIGDPKIVYLDEPTTGMDPVTRRHVWDIIEASKKGRAIVLTTHSMEEADILGDRVAIMARGKLRCIGTPIHLKTKFGAGYLVNVSVRREDGLQQPGEAAREELRRTGVKNFFQEQLDLVPSDENKAYITYTVPRERESQLPGFFKLLEDRKAELGISDLQLGLTTLEEVFLTISRQADLENAAAEGRFETLTVAGKTIKVPVGAQEVRIPDSVSDTAPHGMMVNVFWQQDDVGALKIARHSEPKPAAEVLDSDPGQAWRSTSIGNTRSLREPSANLPGSVQMTSR